MGSALVNKYSIYTATMGHEEYTGLRITPHIYTTLKEIDVFADAVEKEVSISLTQVSQAYPPNTVGNSTIRNRTTLRMTGFVPSKSSIFCFRHFMGKAVLRPTRHDKRIALNQRPHHLVAGRSFLVSGCLLGAATSYGIIRMLALLTRSSVPAATLWWLMAGLNIRVILTSLAALIYGWPRHLCAP